MATADMLLTAEEYAKLPDNGRLTELVRGRIVEMNPPFAWHGFVCANIVGILHRFVAEHGLGRLLGNDSGVITERDPDTVRGPDVAFFSYARWPKGPIPLKGYPPAAPDLVFEVRSPDQSWRELQAKAIEYLGAGVSVVCVIDPSKLRVTIYDSEEEPRVLNKDDTLTFPTILPGFEVPVAKLFE
jgi:Uma2 family endonuclease